MIQFNKIDSLSSLADYLRCDLVFLNDIINDSYIERNTDLNLISYRKNTANEIIAIIIEKSLSKKTKSKERRIVYSIDTEKLKNVIKFLNSELSELYSPPDFVHGFIKGRSIVTNASCHLSKKYILSVDIKSFFESIDNNMICESLKDLGYNKLVSEYLSKLLTINGKLAQGFHTSPTLANIIFKKIDEIIFQVCESDIVYTRYADDLTFSSNNMIPNLDKIEKIINDFGFALNHKKTRYMFRGNKQYVTGLTVFDDKYPRISKKIKRKLRLITYFIGKRGYLAHSLKVLNYSFTDYDTISEVRFEVDSHIMYNIVHIKGWIDYINSIEPKFGLKLKSNLKPNSNSFTNSI